MGAIFRFWFSLTPFSRRLSVSGSRYRPSRRRVPPRRAEGSSRSPPLRSSPLRRQLPSPQRPHSPRKATGRQRASFSLSSQGRCDNRTRTAGKSRSGECFLSYFPTEVIAGKCRVRFLTTPFQTCKHCPQENRSAGVSPARSKSTCLQEAQNSSRKPNSAMFSGQASCAQPSKQ